MNNELIVSLKNTLAIGQRVTTPFKIAALIALAMATTTVQAGYRINNFGGTTTFTNDNGDQTCYNTFGGVTAITQADGSSVRCSSFGGTTTCN